MRDRDARHRAAHGALGRSPLDPAVQGITRVRLHEPIPGEPWMRFRVGCSRKPRPRTSRPTPCSRPCSPSSGASVTHVRHHSQRGGDAALPSNGAPAASAISSASLLEIPAPRSRRCSRRWTSRRGSSCSPRSSPASSGARGRASRSRSRCARPRQDQKSSCSGGRWTRFARSSAESDDTQREIEELKEKITGEGGDTARGEEGGGSRAGTSVAHASAAGRQYTVARHLSPGWLCDMPWRDPDQDVTDLKVVRAVLDEDHTASTRSGPHPRVPGGAALQRRAPICNFQRLWR